MSMTSMSEQEYCCELFKHISKEMLAHMLKEQIRANVPEPLASCYCKQIDDAKTFASILEHYANSSKSKCAI